MLPFLSSLQLADSLFPSGLYTLSHGLEAYAQADGFDVEMLAPLLTDLLQCGVGPSDGVALACAHRAATGGDLDLATRADRRLAAVKLVREAREASRRTGRQLLSLSGEIVGGEILAAYAARVKAGDAPGNHAVVLGLTMAALAIPREQAIAGELYAFAAGCVAAAVRLALIDHRRGQALLHNLRPVIAAVACESGGKDVADIASCAPLAEIMGMRHEAAEIRLFST
ncbi:MAG TPA: urease accessory UreF family protein [Thermomicrobiales bacterium]|nr:urease accessory UreF family protein [Thermomicrobiales bacterium]